MSLKDNKIISSIGDLLNSMLNNKMNINAKSIFLINLCLHFTSNFEQRYQYYFRLVNILFKNTLYDKLDEYHLLITITKYSIEDWEKKQYRLPYKEDTMVTTLDDIKRIIDHNCQIFHSIDQSNVTLNNEDIVKLIKQSNNVFSQLYNKEYGEAKDILIKYHQYYKALMRNCVECKIVILKKEFCAMNSLHRLKCYTRIIKKDFDYKHIFENIKDIIQLKPNDLIRCYLGTSLFRINEVLLGYKLLQNSPCLTHIYSLQLEQINKENIDFDDCIIIEIENRDTNQFVLFPNNTVTCFNCKKEIIILNSCQQCYSVIIIYLC